MQKPKRKATKAARPKGYSLEEPAGFAPISDLVGKRPSPPATARGTGRLKIQGDGTAEDLALLAALGDILGESSGAVLGRGLRLLLESLDKQTQADTAANVAHRLAILRSRRAPRR